jgi:hypothetical protein
VLGSVCSPAYMTASGIELRLLCDVLPVCACSVVLCDLPGLMSPVVVLARLNKYINFRIKGM